MHPAGNFQSLAGLCNVLSSRAESGPVRRGGSIAAVLGMGSVNPFHIHTRIILKRSMSPRVSLWTADRHVKRTTEGKAHRANRRVNRIRLRAAKPSDRRLRLARSELEPSAMPNLW